MVAASFATSAGRRKFGREAVGLGSLDVVQIQLGNQRHVPAVAVGLLCELTLVRERRGHAFVLDVP